MSNSDVKFKIACILSVILPVIGYYVIFPHIAYTLGNFASLTFYVICLGVMLPICMLFSTIIRGSNYEIEKISTQYPYVVGVILGSICLSILNIQYIFKSIRIPDAMTSYYPMMITVSLLSSVVSIIAGWLLQSALVYLLATSLGSSISFRSYCIFVGIAYTGILLCSLAHLVYTFATLETVINFQELQLFTNLSRERNSINRFGELSMLIILTYFVIRYEKLDTISKIAIAFAPTLIVTVLTLFFKSAFNVII